MAPLSESRSPLVRRLARPSLASMADRIVSIVNRATYEECHEGLYWYRAAHAIAADVGARLSLDVAHGAGILAALSPSSPWERNVLDAYALAAGDGAHRFTTYGANVEKAYRIAAGESPGAVLGGRKVRAFYQLILDPEQCGPVCIDRHALAVAVGRPLSDEERKAFAKSRALYDRFQEAYRRAAAVIGTRPHEAQATAWVAWRNGAESRPV